MKSAVAHLEGLGVATEGIRGRAMARKRGRSLGPSESRMEVDEDGAGGDTVPENRGVKTKKVSGDVFLVVFWVLGIFSQGFA